MPLSGGYFAEAGHVRAGAEPASCAGQDDGAHGVVGCRLFDGVAHVCFHLAGPGIEFVRPIERDGRDEIVDAVKNIRVGHVFLLHLSLCREYCTLSKSGPRKRSTEKDVADYCRLRQICLVATDLTRVIADMQAIFGVKLAYQDPHVRRYGLENALFPFGLAFVEVVSPVEADTAAGRFLERTGGTGGYMAIFNCSDPERRGRHANALGVRTAHTINHHGFSRRAAPPEGLPCGDDRVRSDGRRRRPARSLLSSRRNGLDERGQDRRHQAPGRDRRRKPRSRRHWPALVAYPGKAFRADGEGGRIEVDMTAIRFARRHGPRETLRTLVLEVADRGGIEKRAAQRGYPVSDAGVEFCGVRFQLTT